MSRCGSCPLYNNGEPVYGVVCEGNQGVEDCADHLQALVYELLDAVKKAQPRTTLKEWVEQNERMLPNVQFCISPSDTITVGFRRMKHRIFHTLDGEVFLSGDRDGYLTLYGHLEVYDTWNGGDHTLRVYLCPPKHGAYVTPLPSS